MADVAKVVCLLVAFMEAAAPATEAAIQCGNVAQKLIPCLSYLTGGPGPTSACCGGVTALNAMAQTPQDRQATCVCLKNSAGSIPGLSDANAAALPGKCGVSVLYPSAARLIALKFTKLRREKTAYKKRWD